MMVPIDSDGTDYTISSTTRVLGSQNIEVTSTLTVLNTNMNDSVELVIEGQVHWQCKYF